jgi:hypothetical protein
MTIKNGDMPAMPTKISINRNTGEIVPYQFGNDDYVGIGLTKREQFAAMAMQGYIAGGESDQCYLTIGAMKDCVKAADALLAALEGE